MVFKPDYYIVFDIERNFRPYQSNLPSEIIDIGAIKIEAATMHIIDSFSAKVRPKSSISRHTTKLTGITKQHVKTAEKFPQIMKKFHQFIGEGFIFVTWGKEDYAFLQEDCALHKIPCPDMSKHLRFDLQRFVFHAYEELFPSQPSLKLAVEKLSLEWEGDPHRAFDDAKNTANILLKVARDKDISYSYKRKTEPLLFENGILTDRGRKKMTRWVFKELKRNDNSPLTWETFIVSRTWENALDQHDFDESNILLLHDYFKTAVRKAHQQLKALAAMKKTKGTE